MRLYDFENPQLADISKMGKLRISGASAGRFLQTMTTCDVDGLSCSQDYGQSCRGIILDSEAQVIDIITLARTGDVEYMLLTSQSNFQEVLVWLSAHSELEYEEEAVFPHIQIEDESEALCAFALFGPNTQEIVSELCGDTLEEDPPQDVLCIASFDGVPVMLIIESSGGDELRFTVLTLQTNRDLIWNILLSFPEIELADEDVFFGYLESLGSYTKAVADAQYFDPIEARLEQLMRPEGSFVGARALLDKHPNFSFIN